MHETQCIMESRKCLLGSEGHCVQCPYRGYRNDPRYQLVMRLQSWAYTLEKGYPPAEAQDGMEPEVAAILWPESEREFIEREDRWVERAKYHASIATDNLLRQVLIELHDARLET